MMNVPGHTAMTVFYKSGEAAVLDALAHLDGMMSREVATVLNSGTLKWSGGGTIDVVVDFGCGVGRLSRALAKRSKSVFCVDHSARHLEVTRRTLDLQYPKEARRVLLIPTNYVGQELIGILGAARADLVLSLLSLQHMIPQLQVAALEHLCDVLAFGGFGFVQLLTGYTPSPYVDADCNPSSNQPCHRK
mmetsp:Transcript_21769/g.70394  ORF Transcript_21769/g.70394 Transcript_21769/m.70394 type:complete len:190 (-) Transcript_21769:706-1275(-)